MINGAIEKEYVGVRNTGLSTYAAYGVNDQPIGEFVSKATAAFVVNMDYHKNGKKEPNDLSDIPISEIDIFKHRVVPQTEKQDHKHMETTLRRLNKYAVGTKFTNGDGSTFTIIELPEVSEVSGRSFPIKIRFDDTGAESIISSATIDRRDENKSIRDYNKPSVCGVGYTGMQVVSKDNKTQALYSMWRNLMIVCYGVNSKGYIGCKMDPRWHNFANFLEDAASLPGYDNFVRDNYAGYTIENRTLQPNMDPKDRIWSKETCTLIDKTVNRSNMWNDGCYSKKKDIPRGVTKNTTSGYTARFKSHGSIIRIGTFDDPIMAGAASDYYCNYINHRSLNGLSEQIPPYEWQRHKSRMQQMYALTNESEEARRERCKRIYGIEI